MQQDHWRQKYQEALKQAEAEERRWSAVENVLRRIVGRLCIAARGVDPALDAVLDPLAPVVRKAAAPEELEPLFGSLSAAIANLDKNRKLAAAAAGGSAAAASQEAPLGSSLALTAIHGGPVPMATLQSVTELVAGMLERIDIAAERRPQMVGLRDRVLRVTTSVDLAGVLRETADLVNRQRVQLQNEKAEIERLLQQVTTRLDEIANYLTRETEDQQAARASSVTLNDAMLSEVRSLDARVQQATDLATLQRQVRNQLDAISRHLHDFLSREHSRQDAYRDRSEQLRRRIDELEQETRSLNLSLQEKHRQATTDALTGIPNRLAYEQRIDLEYLRWKRAPSPLCIAAWDIDRFKAINDTYGHTGGDKVLSVVGQFFVKNLRRTDFIARYGGEEFTMILVGAAAADALRLTEGLRLSIQNLGFHYHGKPVQITVSCGVAEFRTGDLPEDVFQRADKALYKAKEQGRNCCVAG